MKYSLTCPTIAALFAGLVAAACGGAAGVRSDAAPAPAPQPAPSTAKLEAIYLARMDSARMGFTAADVHFMIGMILAVVYAAVAGSLPGPLVVRGAQIG